MAYPFDSTEEFLEFYRSGRTLSQQSIHLLQEPARRQTIVEIEEPSRNCVRVFHGVGAHTIEVYDDSAATLMRVDVLARLLDPQLIKGLDRWRQRVTRPSLRMVR